MKRSKKRTGREPSAGTAARATGVKVKGIQPGGSWPGGRAAETGRGRTAKAGTDRTAKAGTGRAAKAESGRADLPEFCDYACPHAAFSSPDASGACRRDQAVWCELLARFNNKNARCLAVPGRA